MDHGFAAKVAASLRQTLVMVILATDLTAWSYGRSKSGREWTGR
jgi:hypothetical protein